MRKLVQKEQTKRFSWVRDTRVDENIGLARTWVRDKKMGDQAVRDRESQ